MLSFFNFKKGQNNSRAAQPGRMWKKENTLEHIVPLLLRSSDALLLFTLVLLQSKFHNCAILLSSLIDTHFPYSSVVITHSLASLRCSSKDCPFPALFCLRFQLRRGFFLFRLLQGFDGSIVLILCQHLLLFVCIFGKSFARSHLLSSAQFSCRSFG